ncbi:hypothetical protein SAMN02910370_02553 [Lachnospiraceae bacterium XPB1003]|nr:hypothetical protein SAMN02910370_02553 [Lachnospiraceae bacterium XPB1003]
MKKQKTEGNREYKSDLFSMLMQEKKYALETYNAINNSNHKDPEAIEIITLEHGVSLSIRNDASFILDMSANYYEHQSTYSPNMPLRNLLYYTEDVRRWIRKEEKNIYGRSTISVPTPHFVVFYNGKQKRPEQEIQRLSEAFIKPSEKPELELTCRVININPGNNVNIMQRSSALAGYSYLIELVRKYEPDMVLEEAIRRAIDECIAEDILAEFLRAHRNEVEKIMNLDFTHERQLELTARDEYNAGIQQGIEQERKHTDEQRLRAEAAEARIKILEEALATK